MLDPKGLIACVTENLKARGFHHKRTKEIVGEFEDHMNMHIADGKPSAEAGSLAMKELFENMANESKERLKRTAAMLSTQADNIALVKSSKDAPTGTFLMDGAPGGPGTAAARAAVAKIEHDPRFKTISYKTAQETIRGQLYAIFGKTLEDVGKGAFGRQKGAAHLPNIIREIKGVATGDATAKEVADAWLKISDMTVDMFNAAGGSMRRLERFLPQPHNAVRILEGGEKNYVQFHLDSLDWNETRWPDGSLIKPEQRVELLKRIYQTKITDGASTIDVTKLRGKGKAIGNQLDTHRFMHYKDADAWLGAHERYGEGTIFDVLKNHIEDMAHKIALVETFGPNPEMTANNLKSIVRKEAAQYGPQAVAHAEAVLKNKFEPMFETIMRDNPMDPHSTTGALVTGASNIITSAQLGSAALLAIPGDFMQTVAVRLLNGMGLFSGLDTYFKSLALDPAFQKEIATQSGFVHDEAVMSTYAQSRFTGVATIGPAVTRKISESVMRLSLLSGHTRSARWTVQAEFMGMMHRMKGVEFDKLPFKRMMERYGITPDEWNAFRNTQSWEPRKGVRFLRPIDVMNSDIPNAQGLYRKFQGMIFDEAKAMVPESTIEAGVALKGTTRPDTLAGAVLYSFAMYKNFPLSFQMIYGRMAATAETKMGRVAFYAGLGAGMTMVGAMGTQMREIAKGRDPLPMDNIAFLGKSFLSGGALSIWGDFLFTGVNEYNRGPKDIVAGPLAAALGDTSSLVLGDVFQFADSLGSLQDKDFKSTTLAKSVEYARRYTPGSSIWWARLALERQVFDRLQMLADPKAYQKQRRKVTKQKKDFGNDYWWAPGQAAPN